MQIMTSKEAKNNFGELTKAMLREPVVITKNNKPIGAFVSMQDLALISKHTDHDNWVYDELFKTAQKIEQHGFVGKAHSDEFFDEILAIAQNTA